MIWLQVIPCGWGSVVEDLRQHHDLPLLTSSRDNQSCPQTLSPIPRDKNRPLERDNSKWPEARGTNVWWPDGRVVRVISVG